MFKVTVSPTSLLSIQHGLFWYLLWGRDEFLGSKDIVDFIPDAVRIEVDLGFKGLENEVNNVHLPHKKPKGESDKEI
jgi:hypothetical protein